MAKKPPSGDEQHQRKTGGSSNADSDMGWQRDMEYDNDSVRDDDERLREGLKNGGGGGGGHGGMPDEREKMRSDIEKSLR